MSNELIMNQGTLVRAGLNMQITTAKAYPRNATTFIELATQLATQDEETTQACFYCLPPRKGRDGKVTEIKGASIRLAEIAAACWGNLHAGSRVVENDGQSITAEGVAWNLERNVKISSQVKRSITTQNSARYSNDMQTLTGNTASAIALKNAIFKVIPKALVDCVYEKAVQYTMGDQKDLSRRRTKLFNRFNELGIETPQILCYFHKNSIDEITLADVLADVEELYGIGTSIRGGYVELDKAFVEEKEEITTLPNVEEPIKAYLNN